MLRIENQKAKAWAPTQNFNLKFFLIAEVPLFLLEWLQRCQGEIHCCLLLLCGMIQVL